MATRSRDRIHGGTAAGLRRSDFDPEQLRIGTRVELEHVTRPGVHPSQSDRAIAREIAMDHLAEHPEYYTYLEEAEQRMTRDARARNTHDESLSQRRLDEALAVVDRDLEAAEQAVRDGSATVSVNLLISATYWLGRASAELPYANPTKRQRDRIEELEEAMETWPAEAAMQLRRETQRRRRR